MCMQFFLHRQYPSFLKQNRAVLNLNFFLHFCNREKSKMIILSRNVLQLIYYLPPSKNKKVARKHPPDSGKVAN